jgi:hypothetical protein
MFLFSIPIAGSDGPKDSKAWKKVNSELRSVFMEDSEVVFHVWIPIDDTNT